MNPRLHFHGDSCDCATHRQATSNSKTAGFWSALLPMMACAVCPSCLTLYANILSVLGVGFSLNELHHVMLLVVTISASLAVSTWRSWRTRRVWPIAISVMGSALIAAGHVGGDLNALEWAGVLVLLAGGLIEHVRLRRTRSVLSQSAG